MPQPSAPGAEARLALVAGIGCYFVWGFIPLAFQAIARLGVAPWEILAQRTIWSAPTASISCCWPGNGQVVAVFSNRRVLGWLMLSAALIAINWSVHLGGRPRAASWSAACTISTR